MSAFADETFKVCVRWWHLDDVSQFDDVQGLTVCARWPSRAAIEAARQIRQRMEWYDDGDQQTFYVRKKGSEEIKTFNVSLNYTPNFRASEVKS